jgi:hypothetical protein
MTDDERADMLDEHLTYEWDMLRDSHTKPQYISVGDVHVAKFLGNAMVECFATHARALIEFFNSNGRREDDVRASDFTVSGTYQPGFVSYDDIKHLTTKINKQIAHLTWRREMDQALKFDGLDREEAYERLTSEAEKFRSEMKPELLKWLPDRFGR